MCIAKINAQLEPKHHSLITACHPKIRSRVLVGIGHLDGKLSEVIAVASFCPFCGVRYSNNIVEEGVFPTFQTNLVPVLDPRRDERIEIRVKRRKLKKKEVH
jgi:hypothetical protein